MGCSRVSFLRRVLFVIVFILFLPLCAIGIVLIIPMSVISGLKWIATGCADEDLILYPFEFFALIPYKILE